MPPRPTALPTRFFPADPETTNLTLPTPPIEFSLPSGNGDGGGGDGGPGPSSLAHRLALAAAASQGLLVADLHVTEPAAAGPTSATSRKRKAVAPSTAAGTRKRVQRTDQVDDDLASSGKGKGERSQTAASSAKKKGEATSSSTMSTAQDIRVQPSSDVEGNSSDQGAPGPRSAGEKRRRLDSKASGNSAASDDAASSDAYTDDDGSSEGDDDAAEAALEFSEEEAEEEPVRRKSGRRRRDSPSYVEPLNGGPNAGGPGYEGFAATLGIGGALGKTVKTLPPIVPPSLRGSADLKALLLASVEDEDEEVNDGVKGTAGGMDAGGRSGGVHQHRPLAKSRPSLTTAQLAELERASDPYVWLDYVSRYALTLFFFFFFRRRPARSRPPCWKESPVASLLSIPRTPSSVKNCRKRNSKRACSAMSRTCSRSGAAFPLPSSPPSFTRSTAQALTRIVTGSSRHHPETADIVAQFSSCPAMHSS